jgi:hypothetical protein
MVTAPPAGLFLAQQLACRASAKEGPAALHLCSNGAKAMYVSHMLHEGDGSTTEHNPFVGAPEEKSCLRGSVHKSCQSWEAPWLSTQAVVGEHSLGSIT